MCLRKMRALFWRKRLELQVTGKQGFDGGLTGCSVSRGATIMPRTIWVQGKLWPNNERQRKRLIQPLVVQLLNLARVLLLFFHRFL